MHPMLQDHTLLFHSSLLVLKEPWKSSHCAIYLETTEKHHRRGSILDHAFKIRHLQGFPAEFSRLVPEGSHIAYQWQGLRG